MGTPVSATDRKAYVQKALGLLDWSQKCQYPPDAQLAVAQAHVYALLAQ